MTIAIVRKNVPPDNAFRYARPVHVRGRRRNAMHTITNSSVANARGILAAPDTNANPKLR